MEWNACLDTNNILPKERIEINFTGIKKGCREKGRGRTLNINYFLCLLSEIRSYWKNPITSCEAILMKRHSQFLIIKIQPPSLSDG
jgi:hypothetical protein